MPIFKKIDQDGYFYQYGRKGHHYYFYDENTRKIARKKAIIQGVAIQYSQIKNRKKIK
jgi:hypothetical protein